MRKALIILDLLMLGIVIAELCCGITTCYNFILIMWIVIALCAHLELYKRTHR